MTDQATDANDVLMGGGGAPVAKFDQGTTVGGVIVAKPRAHHEREYDPKNPGHGAPKYFPSGDPIMGITVDVQTNMRDASITDDDGVRRIYIEGKRMKEAARTAIKATGAAGLEVGGEVWFTQVGREPDEQGRITDQSPKTWAVRYVPLATVVLNGQTNNVPVTGTDGMIPTPPAQAAPVQQTAPVQQAAPPANGPSPEAVAALRAAGVDPATVFPGYTG